MQKAAAREPGKNLPNRAELSVLIVFGGLPALA
jgi:hypothetical protein